MHSRGYGYVGAPRFGACSISPTFGAKLFVRKTSADNFFQIIVPCKEYKITNWEQFWEMVKSRTLEEIFSARQQGFLLSEVKIAADILQCMDGDFVSKDYYKLAYTPKYARFVFELNKYILGIFYQEGLITETDAKKRVAGILKNLNTRAL